MNPKEKTHFLLIDDNRIDLVFHEKLLRSHKISTDITTFSQATAALKYLQNQNNREPYGWRWIILLDIQMPIMDGFEFLDHLESMPEDFLQKIHVICVSSALTPETTKKCKNHPAVEGVLRKPLNANELVSLLRAIRAA